MISRTAMTIIQLEYLLAVANCGRFLHKNTFN